MKPLLLAGFAALLAVSAPAEAQAPAPAGDPAVLHVSASAVVLEQAPLVLAIERFYGGKAVLGPPGIPALFGEGGALVKADLAGHAETQALRNSVRHPDLRVIMTVTEARYRLVGRRSHGLAKLADLKGKTVGAQLDTSAVYFLERMLKSAGLRETDVRIVGVPAAGTPGALARGEVDAVAIWEPEASLAEKAVGADAVVFPGDKVYRALYGLNTTEAALKDPASRARIVRFVRAVLDASAEARRDPAAAQAAVARQTRHPAAEVAAAWPTYRFVGGLHPGLLDTLADEELWLARLEKRPARGRAELARLIDPSVLKEAKALR